MPTPTCGICTNCTKKQLKKIAEAYEGGDTAEALAMTFSQGYEDMVYHCTKCLTTGEVEESAPSILRSFLKATRDMASKVEQAFDGDNNRSDLVHAFTSLSGEARTLLDKLDTVKDPAEITKIVIAKALNPLIKKGIEAVTKELIQVRTDLINAGAKSSAVDTVINQVVLGYGQTMKSVQADVVERLAKSLGVSAKEIPVILSTTVAKKDEAKN